MKNTAFTPRELRKFRESLGLSRKQFADLIDVTERTVYNWETRPSRRPLPKRIQHHINGACGSDVAAEIVR